MKRLCSTALSILPLVSLAQQWNFYNGNVGFGTSTPSAPLEIKAASRWEGTISANANGYTSFAWLYNDARKWSLYNHPGLSNQLLLANENGNDRFSFTQHGRLGINRINPEAAFHLQQTGAGAWNEGIRLSYYGTAWDIVVDDNGNRLVLAKNQIATSGLVIQNGKVGIGTASPDATLTVNGSLRILESSGLQYGFGTSGDPVKFLAVDVVNSASNSDPLELVYNRGPGVTIDSVSTPGKFLKVHGVAYAKEVNVTLTIPGPDYVF